MLTLTMFIPSKGTVFLIDNQIIETYFQDYWHDTLQTYFQNRRKRADRNAVEVQKRLIPQKKRKVGT